MTILSEVPKLLDRAFAHLEWASERSNLPEDAPATADLEPWLIELRRKKM